VRRMAGNVRSIPLSSIAAPGESAPAWFASTRQTQKPGWSLGFFANQAGRVPVCWYAVPYFEQDRFRGVLAVAIRAQALHSTLVLRARTRAAQPAEGARSGERSRARSR